MSNPIFSLIRRGGAIVTAAGGRLQSPFLLAVRLYWGWQLMQAGWGKLHNVDGVTNFFMTLNIPFPHANAIFIANLEFFGGLLLLLGVATRFVGLLMAGNMIVAYLTADREALRSVFSDPGKFYNADPYTFLFASVLMVIFGAGLFSGDALFARLSRREVTIPGAVASSAGA